MNYDAYESESWFQHVKAEDIDKSRAIVTKYDDGLQAMLCHNTLELCIKLCVPEGLSQNPVFLRNVKLSGYYFSTS